VSLLLLILCTILIAPNTDSLLTALQGKEKARIIFLGIALAATVLVGIVTLLTMGRAHREFLDIGEERSVYPPVYTLECVLRC
jgi:hypothetical protein